MCAEPLSETGAVVLAIETSNPSSAAGVAVGRFGPGRRVAMLAQHRLARGDRHDDQLMPAIAHVCAEAGVAPRQLRAIAVSTGPGGYTALRIAVTSARMIAHSVGCGVIDVHSAMSAAFGTARAGAFGDSSVAVALHAKDGTAHVTLVDVFLPGADAGERSMPVVRLRRELGVVDASGLASWGVGWLVADEHAPAEFRAGAEAMRMPVVPPVFDPASVLELAHGLDPSLPESLSVRYGREAEAVTQWRRLHG